MHDRVACTRVLYHHCIHINVRSIGRMTKGIEMSFFKIYRPDVGGHESLGWPVVWSQWRRHQSVCNSVINSVRHSVNNVLQLTIFLAVTLMTLCIGICINVQPKTFGNHRCWRRLPDHVLCLWWTCDMYLAPKLAVWRKLYHGDCTMATAIMSDISGHECAVSWVVSDVFDDTERKVLHQIFPLASLSNSVYLYELITHIYTAKPR